MAICSTVKFADGPHKSLSSAFLAGVEVGGPTEAIEKTHPGIYKHRLGRLATLWEACNQNDLQVFTFAEEPILKGLAANIDIQTQEDVTVCRDSTPPPFIPPR